MARFRDSQTDARIREVLEFFRSRNQAVTWITGPSTQPSGLGRRLVAHGLQHVKDELGMAAELNALGDPPPAPTGFRCERVLDGARFEDFARVHAAVHDLTPAQARSLFENVPNEGFPPKSPQRLYVGYLHGDPVTASMIFLGETTAGIYAVATLPTLRRRGLGSLMTAVPLVEAKERGYEIGTLTASGMGSSLYRKLGFREYCTMKFYAFDPTRSPARSFGRADR